MEHIPNLVYLDPTTGIRLPTQALSLIRAYVQDVDPKAQAYVFGSRADANKRGGDIDIAVISNVFDYKNARVLRLRLTGLLGEQKIDVVYAKDNTTAFLQSVIPSAKKIL